MKKLSGLLRRTASSTLKVPRALISKSSRGSVTEVVTATWPARCSRQSGRTAATMRSTAAASRTSARSNRIGGALLQPAQVVLGAAAREVVEDRHLPALRGEMPRGVDADEAGAAGDQDLLAHHCRWRPGRKRHRTDRQNTRSTPASL